MSNMPNLAKNRARAEATATTVDFDFRGKTYTFDPALLTWDVLEADSRGQTLYVVRTLLGDAQWAEFTAANPEPLKVDDDGTVTVVLAEMGVALMEAMGNLGASSGS